MGVAVLREVGFGNPLGRSAIRGHAPQPAIQGTRKDDHVVVAPTGTEMRGNLGDGEG